MRRWWCLLWSPRIPEPWPEGAWHCPECGRVLVGQARPGRSALLRFEAMTRAERVADCLVHGATLALEQRRELAPDEVRARALVLAATLPRRWAARLRGTQGLYDLAHYLWWLRHDRCTAADTAEVERLLYAIGLLLPAPGPRQRIPGTHWTW